MAGHPPPLLLLLTLAAPPHPHPPEPWSSGTSWQPVAAGMEGLHFAAGPWRAMLHGQLAVAWTSQEGPRGASEAFFTTMVMASGERTLGPGTLILRAMLSAEPALGPEGYPLLLQTGETADGLSHLVDRQHPHDLPMELAAAYRLPLGARAAIFLYAGLPGEPALGPPAFMHRPSGTPNPVAPLAHHWLDSTHVTFGVATLGVTLDGLKLDGSLFNGREPDERRWGVETGPLDSWSARLTWNPSPAWSLQASVGRLRSPEAFHPGVDVTRATASAQWSLAFGSWRSDGVLAWGCNRRSRPLSLAPYPEYGPRQALNAALLETAARRGPLALFARAEWIEKDELFPRNDPFLVRVFPVSKLEIGVAHDLPVGGRLVPSLGLAGSLHHVPEHIEPEYGRSPLGVLAFVALRLR